MQWMKMILPIVLLAPAWATAQPPDAEHRDRARTFLVVSLADRLELSDEKALKLSKILRASDARRRELRQQRRAVERQIRDELKGESGSAAKLAGLVAEANRIDEQVSLVPQRSVREMQKILTVEQQAKLALFRPEIENRVRKAIKRFREGGPARPARRPPRFRD